jgi:predicted site-specific integrase-resolvase
MKLSEVPRTPDCPIPPSDLVTHMPQHEAMAVLNVSRKTLYKRRQLGLYRCIRRNGRVLYSREDVARDLANPERV